MGGNPFQDVSWSRPFGNSFLGNALGGNPNAPLNPDGTVKQTGEQLYYNPDAPPGAGAGLPTTAPVQTYKAPSFSANNTFNRGYAPTYLDSAAEKAFRDSYLKSLKPNTTFNLNAEISPFKATSLPTNTRSK